MMTSVFILRLQIFLVVTYDLRSLEMKHPTLPLFSTFRMIINYTFNFQHQEFTYSVFFYGDDYVPGPAHSAQHQMRRDWARRLPITRNWAILEYSDYKAYLEANDLFYTQYCVFKYENAITIFIK